MTKLAYNLEVCSDDSGLWLLAADLEFDFDRRSGRPAFLCLSFAIRDGEAGA